MAQINKPTDYFNTVTYSGSVSPQSITGVGFQPDWTWIKCRNNAQEHMLFDSIRGVTNYIQSDNTNAEATNANSLTSFDSDGFSLGSLGEVNANTYTYVSWNWLGANASSSNTDGSITSSVSANTTSGFSIVSYTGNGTAGATIGHGLGVAPKMVIVKGRDNANHWTVYHESMGGGQYFIDLNQTNQVGTSTSVWNDTNTTSSVFSVGTNSRVNTSSYGYIAYCFAEKKGFSKFGSYTGNGSTDGTFVYTGFKPAFVIIKGSSVITNWTMYDNKRDPSNTTTQNLRPNTNGAETTDHDIDMLSNGFKHRGSGSGGNGSGSTYIYMAFAESPLVGTNNIPATAR